ncbi:ester cyclase [Natrarchaeobius chitinivorans]|nr:ester cyclase [Natrarchaeobius chitinivorans]
MAESSTHETNKEIVSRWWSEYWDKLNPDIVDELAEDGIRWYYPLVGEVRGREEVKKRIIAYKERFPEGGFELTDELIADGDRVVALWEGGGTHTGRSWELPLGSLPEASGERAQYTGTTVFTVQDGKITEEYGQADYLGVMQQLGLIDPETD